MSPSRLRPALLTLITLTLLVAGCSPKTAVAQSQVARDKAPNAPPQALAQLVAGNSAFAFDLYQNLRQTDGNLFFSPYSVSSALAMTFAGARGDTEAQMAGALHYTLGQDGLHPAFNALDLALNNSGTGADKGSFTLRSVNSLWAQQDYKFLPAFLDVLGATTAPGCGLWITRTAATASRRAWPSTIGSRPPPRTRSPS
jgi:serpin B